MEQAQALSPVELETRDFVTMAYNWMAQGLLVTAAVSLFMAAHPVWIERMVRTGGVFMGLMLAELVLVYVLAGWVEKMSTGAAAAAFLGYAALNGLTISVIFLAYAQSSIASTFFISAGTFWVMSLYGHSTKTDLTTVGNLCLMGLIGLLLATFVNFWTRSPVVEMVSSYAGVLIFTGLTAYDAQKVKSFNNPADEGTDREKKEAISAALALYLDFINLFLQLLKLLGRRRED